MCITSAGKIHQFVFCFNIIYYIKYLNTNINVLSKYYLMIVLYYKSDNLLELGPWKK